MYKLIIFDLDGTLLDTSRTIQSVLNESLKKFSLPQLSIEKTVEYVGNGAKKLIERAVGTEHKELIEAVYADYSERFSADDNKFTTLYNGVYDTLKKLSNAGIYFAIITNKPQQATLRVYEKFLSEFNFAEVRGQASDTPLKPNPQSTLEIMYKYRVKPEECLFVGDGETDVQTAANAGIKCVSALWGFRTREQLCAAGAALFARNFTDLEKIVLQ